MASPGCAATWFHFGLHRRGAEGWKQTRGGETQDRLCLKGEREKTKKQTEVLSAWPQGPHHPTRPGRPTAFSELPYGLGDGGTACEKGNPPLRGEVLGRGARVRRHPRTPGFKTRRSGAPKLPGGSCVFARVTPASHYGCVSQQVRTATPTTATCHRRKCVPHNPSVGVSSPSS